MAMVLLKPYLLGYKNRLLAKRQGSRINRELVTLVLTLGFAVLIYLINLAFVESLRSHPAYDPRMFANLVRLFLFGFFVLLLFSGTIVALSSLFMSQEVPLLLSAPVSSLRLFGAKLIEISLMSAWVFLLFGVPVCMAFYQALDLPTSFLLTCIFGAIPFVLTPCALAILVITLFVNLIPPYRMRDLLVIIAFFFSCGLLYFGHQSPEYFPTEDKKINELVNFLGNFRDPQPIWTPSRWLSELLVGYLGEPGLPAPLLFVLLYGTAFGTISASYLVFDSYFKRGLSVSTQGNKHARIYSSDFTAFLGRVLLPWDSQFRALFYKEARMFIRDTTQALQLMMLLLLTFMYLYNFRSLRTASQLTGEGLVWWQVILAVANIAFGACVVAAIATRFVFPSVSLEGRAFSWMRSAPISLEKFLRYKFLTWLGPMTVLSVILLASGAFAIQGTTETIVATVVIAVALAIGITGLGIGAGAYYARFDWESPAQVTASFGSLVYMLLSLTNIFFSIIPAFFLFILTCVPDFAEQMNRRDYYLSVAASMILLLFINLFACRQALSAGATSLKEMGA